MCMNEKVFVCVWLDHRERERERERENVYV